MKKLFAIDAGPTESAWLEYVPATAEPPGTVLRFGISPNKEIEARIAHTMHSDEWIVVCEDMGTQGGTVGAETFNTAKQIGRFGLWAEMSNLAFEEMDPATKKEFLLGARVGKDKDIRAALCLLWGLPVDAKPSQLGPLKGIATHVWSALAVAAAWDRRETMRRARRG